MREGCACVERQTSSLGNGETEPIENLCWSKAWASVARPICSERTPRVFSNRLSTLILRTTGRRERIFRAVFDPHSIVRAIEARTGQRIVPGKTLLFIDEIQACEEALTSLKYFCEDAPEYYVAAAGSLLGVAINHQSVSFPVGKTDLIEMTPLHFEEFLWAMGHDQLVGEIRCHSS